MDPNLYHLEWGRLLEVLVTIVILSFLIERGLSLLFESKFFINRLQGKSLKELIAFIVGATVCIVWDFDAISMILLRENVTIFGAVLTGCIIAGGSKGSIKLFKDIMGFMSTAEATRLGKIQITKKKKNDK